MEFDDVLEIHDVKGSCEEEQIEEHFVKNLKSEIGPIDVLQVKSREAVILSDVIVKFRIPVVHVAFENKILEADLFVIGRN